MRSCVLVLFLFALPLSAATDWGADLASLVAQVEKTHPRFRDCKVAAEFETRAKEIALRAPQLSDAQMIVEIQRLLASAGDGHTLLFPFALEKLPVMLWSFDDGVYVVDAKEKSFIGRRVEAIGGLPVEDVFARLEPFISHDNAMQLRWAAPFYATLPDFLSAIGATGPLRFDNGETATLTAEPIDPDTLALKLPPRASRRLEEPFRTEEVPGPILLITVNGMRDAKEMTLAQFGVDVRKRLARYDRAIVDLRLNNGGEASKADELFRTLVAFDARGGRLITLISRMTFSAAQTFATRIDQWTNTLFAGEPTGSRPNHYGNEHPFVLPESKLRGTISSGFNQPVSARDDRDSIRPDIAIPALASDYFAGRDAVLDAAKKSLGSPTATTPLFGTWSGASLCTPVRPACHDERAVYHVAPSSHPNTVLMMMNKIVDGKEVEMGGTLEYQRDGETLTYVMAMRDGTKGEWKFVVNGNHMTGTLKQMPGGEVVRNIALDKTK